MRLKNNKKSLLALFAAVLLGLSACAGHSDNTIDVTDTLQDNNTVTQEQTENSSEHASTEVNRSSSFNLSSIPAYSGEPYVAVNNNVPYFTDNDLAQTASFETYSDLDSLRRCGVAYANVGQDLMPAGKRGSIGQVKPSGWHTVKYDNVDGKFLYNRCHLIGWQLSGEDANEKNLITGTRYLNVTGMLPFENMVADYIKETNNHVLYRVTPVFEGNNLVANGVLMEAISVEDRGDGVEFNVFCYNAQPGISIDYATGDSHADGSNATASSSTSSTASSVNNQTATSAAPATSGTTVKEDTSSPTSAATYILNSKSKKFHLPTCSSIGQMKEANKEEYTGSRDELIAQGYDPCKKCNP